MKFGTTGMANAGAGASNKSRKTARIYFVVSSTIVWPNALVPAAPGVIVRTPEVASVPANPVLAPAAVLVTSEKLGIAPTDAAESGTASPW
ncbi:hypothetical protein [uncultured Oceanicoccus sp.]|uniref:hypothetical protein n=1 Tax=uncultured Oceanicoccus sp. TaxID=1706381 RepID=UPI0030D83B3C